MYSQLEQKYEQSIWTEKWTFILIKNMNKFFEQTCEELSWTDIETNSLNIYMNN